MTALKGGDIAVRLFGDDAGDLVYVIDVGLNAQGREWVTWSYHEPHPGTKITSGSVPEFLRPATAAETLLWKLGVNTPTREHREALALYVEGMSR